MIAFGLTDAINVKTAPGKEPATKVFVVSDQLEIEVSKTLATFVAKEANWLKDSAPAGSKTIFVNGFTGELVGTLEAQATVPRLRGQYLAQPFKSVMEFCNRQRATEDNRLNVPRIIRNVLPNLNVPPKC